MPLSTNEQTNKTAGELVDTLKGAFHTPAGYRPAHAKGLLLTGTFIPTALAASLSCAPHFAAPVPVTARFSSSTGIPTIPDTDAQANPRGLAVRFELGGRAHTDIIAHSTPYFPTRTGDGFLQLLQAIGGGTVGDFLAKNPAAKRFVEAPKPTPDSLEHATYYAVNAYRLVDAGGNETIVRYRIVPASGGGEADGKADGRPEGHGDANDFLFDKLKATVGTGPIRMTLVAQVAETGDVSDDATVLWPEDRKIVELGQITLDKVRDDTLAAQQHIIFDPVPRVRGVEPSADPLLDMRASVYLISGRQRREADAEGKTDG
ncbi:hypothetical protein Q5752_000334 [Cryptotrichosporon argae]